MNINPAASLSSQLTSEVKADPEALRVLEVAAACRQADTLKLIAQTLAEKMH